ncbi:MULTISPECIES: hypothetical protein [unclassified Nocardioides]|jgi:hypothetical protein|uniref:hypothetical protein n=1 Tax=Nocardioides sp. URHA0032 TaxID=1380388 RepID=UPI000AC7A1E6|nr:hypothetical protein [Nocardioides sp. URHA0032]
MSESGTTAPEPDELEIFDVLPEGSATSLLACRVCGALVPSERGCPRVHWDWHEATNGA